jgi:hypothetical protein
MTHNDLHESEETTEASVRKLRLEHFESLLKGSIRNTARQQGLKRAVNRLLRVPVFRLAAPHMVVPETSEFHSQLDRWARNELQKETEIAEESYYQEIKDWLSFLKDWRLWIGVGIVIYVLIFMVLYPFVGLLFSLGGVIASATIRNENVRIPLIVFFALFLLWSARGIEQPQYTDVPIPDPPEESVGYGPAARP